MCEIKTDEIERLVKLRREAEERLSEAAQNISRYGYGSSIDRDARAVHGAWACIKRLIENRIVEALGGQLATVSHTEDGGES